MLGWLAVMLGGQALASETPDADAELETVRIGVGVGVAGARPAWSADVQGAYVSTRLMPTGSLRLEVRNRVLLEPQFALAQSWATSVEGEEDTVTVHASGETLSYGLSVKYLVQRGEGFQIYPILSAARFRHAELAWWDEPGSEEGDFFEGSTQEGWTVDAGMGAQRWFGDDWTLSVDLLWVGYGVMRTSTFEGQGDEQEMLTTALYEGWDIEPAARLMFHLYW